MRIEEYKKISDDVEIPETFLAGYQKAIVQIKAESTMEKKRKHSLKWMSMRGAMKVAVFAFVMLVVGGSVFTVRAYISHMERLRNLQTEEVLDLYENVFQYDSGFMSRSLSESEESRYANQYDLYCNDFADPQGEVKIINAAKEYSGKGIAFCKKDGILYLPKEDMTDEEILQVVEFMLLKQYVDYEAYLKASNPLHYKNRYDEMTGNEVEEIYKEFHSANTETSFLSRELSLGEKERRKILKDLYQQGMILPEKKIAVIENKQEALETELSFCKWNCTYYLPGRELSDEEILELIEHQMKAAYCFNRISEEVRLGIRTDWPKLDLIERDRIYTLNPEIPVDEELMKQPWLAAYSEVLEEYYRRNEEYYENPERYYANIHFIYLNDDEIPEMLFSHGCTDFDYDDHCNTRVYLYTYQYGRAVMLSSGENTADDFYGYEKPFSYVEKKGMVYCDYYYCYDFSTYDKETGMIDSVHDNMSRIDTWNLDDMTCKSTLANIRMLHAKYNYTEEEYDDAEFSYEYYINVSDIIRDRETGEVTEIVGKKVSQAEYEQAEKNLWGGEVYVTLQVTDFDKIYCDDDIVEALAKCCSGTVFGR